MKYQHAEALALALHSCVGGVVDAQSQAVFTQIVDTLARFVEAQPTLYTGKQFADVAWNGKAVSPGNPPSVGTPVPSVEKMRQLVRGVSPSLANLVGSGAQVTIVNADTGQVLFDQTLPDTDDDADEGPPSDPKAEAKARRALRRAKRQAEADAALLAAIAANGAGQGNSAQP